MIQNKKIKNIEVAATGAECIDIVLSNKQFIHIRKADLLPVPQAFHFGRHIMDSSVGEPDG